MGQEEPVQKYHGRQVYLLRYLVSQDDRVEEFLVCLAIELHPAGVPLRKGVDLVGPQAPGWAERAVYVRHDDGEPGPSCPVKHLVHQGQPMGRRGGEGSSPSRTGGEDTGHCRMFRLDFEEFCLQHPIGAHLGEFFYDRRLGSDRIG